MKPLVMAALAAGALSMLTSSKPRGIRNNNPLNVRENDLVDYDWLGEAGADYDPEFEEFTSPFYGIRAGARVLRTYRLKHGLSTISGIIGRWAPRHENETESYINGVSGRLGVHPDQPLSVEQYPDLVAAMIHHENGQQPYSMEQILKGVASGFA